MTRSLSWQSARTVSERPWVRVPVGTLYFLPCDIWWLSVGSRLGQRACLVFPPLFRADSRTNLIKQGENVNGRPSGSLAQLAEFPHGKRETLSSSPGQATILPLFDVSSDSTNTLHFKWKIFSFLLTYHTSCICPSNPLRFESRFHQGDKINDECVLIDTKGN